MSSFCRCFKKKTTQVTTTTVDTDDALTDPTDGQVQSPEQRLQALLDKEGVVQLSASDIKVVGLLGSGFFGSVYKGTWQGLPVALKFSSQEEEAGEDIKKECRSVRELRHPNIMQLYGICEGSKPEDWPEDAKPPAMVCELLGADRITDWLQRQPTESRSTEAHWRRVCSLLADAASGLAALHTAKVLHRDIKADNLVMDREEQSVKWVDFGLARKLLRQESKNLGRAYTKNLGTWTHKAPEMLASQVGYDTSVDVFSFGIVISEAICGKNAEDLVDDTRADDFTLKAEALHGFLEGSPEQCSRLVDLAALCCDIDASKRPTADAVHNSLCEIRDLFSDCSH